MGTHIIRFSLDTASINRAIREVRQYRESLESACKELVEKLTDEGVKIAKMQVISLGAIDTGELQGSIEGYYSPSLNAGFVYAGAWYAVFVEYGTGIVGEASPHPKPDGWAYDVNSHGEKGWVYMSDRDGKFHWTKGQPSRPFMYNTFRELERRLPDAAKEVFDRL